MSQDVSARGSRFRRARATRLTAAPGSSVCAGQGGREQQPALPRAEVGGEDRADPLEVGAPTAGVQRRHRTCCDTAGDQHGDAAGDELPHRLGHRRWGVACAEGLQDDAAGAGGDRRPQQGVVDADVQGDDVDARQGSRGIQRERRRPALPGQREDSPRHDAQGRTPTGGGEGSGSQGLGLAHPPGLPRQSVEHQQGAQATPVRAGGDRQRRRQVAGAVRRGAVEGTLGTGEDDGSVVLVDEVQQERRLLHGVGAMGDDDAVDAVIQRRTHPAGEAGQVRQRERVAAPAAHILDLDALPAQTAGLQQLRASGAGQESLRRAAAGDGAAGGDESGARQTGPPEGGVARAVRRRLRGRYANDGALTRACPICHIGFPASGEP